jgi:Zn-dependent peptidase ImmA (M78 family)
MTRPKTELHPHVVAILEETERSDPFVAVRIKARVVAERYFEVFGEVPPFNMKAVASLQGLHWSDDNPRYSEDSEIVPRRDGRVEIRVNRDRPHTRQRFSIGHEIGHTLFPDYTVKVQCRKAIDRDWADPNDLIEALCDAAATEFLFPAPWFFQSIERLDMSAESIAGLASGYQASRDATVRRLVELNPMPLAAVFLRWKWKPTEISAMRRDKKQRRIPSVLSSQPQKKLRVDYAVINSTFASRYGDHIPKDKSVPSEGPIFDASTDQRCCDGVMSLELGSVYGRFRVAAIPLYTADDSLGDGGEVSVVAVLSPKGKSSAR